MSAQTTISQPARGIHNGLLGSVILVIAGAVAAVALSATLLTAGSRSPAPNAVHGFNAAPFRAEAHNYVVAPAFDANAFRAEERQTLGFDASGFRAEERQPLTFDWNAFRAEERQPLR